MSKGGSGDNFFSASMEPPDSLGPKPTSSHNVLIRGNTPAHGLGEPVHVDAELSKGDRTATVRTKKMLSAIKDGTQQVGDQQRRMIIGATTVLLFSMVFLAGSTLAVVYTRETHVDTNSSGPILVDNNDQTVATGSVQRMIDFTDLPSRGPDFPYNQISDIKLNLGGRKLGFKVVGYEWYNTTDMDMFLANFGPDGLTLHMSNTSLTLGEGATAVDFFGDASEQADRRRLSMSRGRQLGWKSKDGGRKLVKFILYEVIMEGGKAAYDWATSDDDDKEGGGGGGAESESADGKDSGESGEDPDAGTSTNVHGQGCPPRTIC